MLPGNVIVVTVIVYFTIVGPCSQRSISRLVQFSSIFMVNMSCSYPKHQTPRMFHGFHHVSPHRFCLESAPIPPALQHHLLHLRYLLPEHCGGAVAEFVVLQFDWGGGSWGKVGERLGKGRNEGLNHGKWWFYPQELWFYPQQLWGYYQRHSNTVILA